MAFVSPSLPNCPASSAGFVFELAQSFGVGVVAVRRSRRSFSGWVAVCSFPSRSVAVRFCAVAGLQLFGCPFTYLAFRRSGGGRWRVSVPVARPSGAAVLVRRGRPRVGRFRVVVAS
ncbi:MAG: hypothetical protein AAGG00_05495 [Cyanobacteria bacterium P01_H01_bin.150]